RRGQAHRGRVGDGRAGHGRVHHLLRRGARQPHRRGVRRPVMLPLPAPTTYRRRMVRIALGTLVLLAVAVAAVTGYGLLTTRHTKPVEPRATAASSTPDPVATATPAALAPPGLPPIIATANPVTFATAVSRALFDWDTTGRHTLADHKGRLLVVADPSG